MKLWHIAQWGNARDNDGNEPDTNVVVRANDLLSAVKEAEYNFKWWNSQYLTKDTYSRYKKGTPSVAYFIGNEARERDESDDKAQVVMRPWIDNALNLGGYEAWYLDEKNNWLTQEERYGKDE